MEKVYKISIDGCDDSTIFEMALSEEELAFLRGVEKLAEKYSEDKTCRPTIEVTEVNNSL